MSARWLIATLLAVTVGATRHLPAQQPTFEVSSVKRNPGSGRAVQFVPASGPPVLMTYHSVSALIRYAYGLTGRFELRDEPEWVLKELYDVRGVPPSGTTEKDVPQMMQTLLAERFKLRLRRETRDQPVYALVVDRADGRLGPQLTLSMYDCKAFFAAGNTVASPGAPLDEHGRRVCGTNISLAKPGGVFAYGVRGVPIADFAHGLETWNLGSIDRPLVDRTGLTGYYDIKVEFISTAPLPGGAPPEGTILPVAMKEQLGLRLEPRMEPRTTYVIEAIGRPTAD